MKLFFTLLGILLFLTWYVMASTQVSITGGKVTIQSGIVDIGTTVLASTAPIPSDKAGQCIGILCGVTYN